MTNIMTLKEVLTDPNLFFSNLMEQKPSLKTPAMIITLIAILSAISAAMVTQKIMTILPEEAAAFASIGMIAGSVGAIFGVFFMWVLYSGIFYIISAILGGQGEFKRVMEVVAYGFIPSIFSGIIGMIAMATSFSVEGLDINDPVMMQQAMTSDPVMQMTMLTGIIFTIWSANIWIFGLRHARDLTTRNAVISVLVPVMIYILYSARSLIGV